jgi:hypothetical protein
MRTCAYVHCPISYRYRYTCIATSNKYMYRQLVQYKYAEGVNSQYAEARRNVCLVCMYAHRKAGNRRMEFGGGMGPHP